MKYIVSFEELDENSHIIKNFESFYLNKDDYDNQLFLYKNSKILRNDNK